MLQQPDLELNETVSKVAAVLTQAAVAHLMAAHVKLEVLLELTDLGIFQGSGTHNVDQTPAEKYKAPEDQTLPTFSLYDIQTFYWAGKGHKQIDFGRGRFSLGKQTPALPPYQVWVVIFTLSPWVMLCLNSEIRQNIQ